jgi:hypothetical protein
MIKYNENSTKTCLKATCQRFVGFEILVAMIMKRRVSWAPCSSEKAACFCWFLAWLTLHL